jgi:hypothetical protein
MSYREPFVSQEDINALLEGVVGPEKENNPENRSDYEASQSVTAESEFFLSEREVEYLLDPDAIGVDLFSERKECTTQHPEVHGIFHVRISGFLMGYGSAHSEVRLNNLMAYDRDGNKLPDKPFYIANFPLYEAEKDSLKISLRDNHMGQYVYARIEHGVLMELRYEGVMINSKKDG